MNKEGYEEKYRDLDYKKKYPCIICGKLIYPCEDCIEHGVGLTCDNCMPELAEQDVIPFEERD